jgi:hypothetical protein
MSNTALSLRSLEELLLNDPLVERWLQQFAAAHGTHVAMGNLALSLQSLEELLLNDPLVEQWLQQFAAPHGTQSVFFTLYGDVVHPSIYTANLLAHQQPVTTEPASYTAGGSPVHDVYTGISLWNLVSNAGGFVVSDAKNDILRKFIIATGSDGYQAVFAAGEIDPNFGNRPYLVAYHDTAGQLGANGPDGFARIVADGDKAGGRYVSNLVSLQVGSIPAAPPGPGGHSTAFYLSGQVAHPGAYNAHALAVLHQNTTETATYTAGGTPVTDTYTGVSLWTLINDAGLLTDPTIKNDVLHDVVVATGSDGYQAVISLGEIDPAFGNQPDLVAYTDTGGQLGAHGADGFARLVVPGDLAGGRYVSNLVSLQVLDATSPHTSL